MFENKSVSNILKSGIFTSALYLGVTGYYMYLGIICNKINYSYSYSYYYNNF